MIIAEISQNFTCLAEAKQLVRLAKTCGADLAKAQLFDSVKLYGKKVPAELSFCDAKALFDYGASIGIEVFFSVFDTSRVEWCEEIGVKRYKIATRMREKELLEAVIHTGKPVIRSVGHPHSHAYVTKPPNFTLICCIPEYPTPLEKIHLDEVIFEPEWMAGLSDHTIGIDVAKIALARGAKIIEKHFSLSYDIGIDGKWSMTPLDLRELKRWEIVCNQSL